MAVVAATAVMLTARTRICNSLPTFRRPSGALDYSPHRLFFAVITGWASRYGKGGLFFRVETLDKMGVIMRIIREVG